MELPESITVTIIYDKELQKITGVAQEPAVVSKGLVFIMFLNFIFKSYPEIMERYPPGTLGLAINDKPPTEFTILEDGDLIELTVPNSSIF